MNGQRKESGGGEGKESNCLEKGSVSIIQIYFIDFVYIIGVVKWKWMEEGIKNQNLKSGRKGRKKAKMDSPEAPAQIKNQEVHRDAQGHASDASNSSSGWSHEVIQPALKTMNFRKKRGTRMKELIKGKSRKDHFWEKYQDYFGGDINKRDDQEDEQDYQASSSGRDQFDSDFDLTDSYVGKRGRKKGTKIKKRKKAAPKPQQDKEQGEPKPKGKRGRKKKVPIQPVSLQKSEILLKEEKPQNCQGQNQLIEQKNIFLAQMKCEEPRQECEPHQSKGKVAIPESVIEEKVEKIEQENIQNESEPYLKIGKEEEPNKEGSA